MALSLKKGRKTRKRKKDKFRRRTNLSKDDYSSIRKGGGGSLKLVCVTNITNGVSINKMIKNCEIKYR